MINERKKISLKNRIKKKVKKKINFKNRKKKKVTKIKVLKKKHHFGKFNIIEMNFKKLT